MKLQYVFALLAIVFASSINAQWVTEPTPHTPLQPAHGGVYIDPDQPGIVVQIQPFNGSALVTHTVFPGNPDSSASIMLPENWSGIEASDHVNRPVYGFTSFYPSLWVYSSINGTCDALTAELYESNGNGTYSITATLNLQRLLPSNAGECEL